MTSLGCARCGDCCTDIYLNPVITKSAQEWREYYAAGGEVPIDPDYDPSFEFIVKHWTLTASNEDGSGHHECDQFDSESRLCLAHDSRPPVCSGYPWYEGRDATTHPKDLHPRCSFALDVPVAERREDARPLIPVTVIHR